MRKVNSGKMFDTDTAFAAACAALAQTNGEYIKVKDIVPSANTNSNREITISFLNNPETITEQDRFNGQRVREHYKGLVFAILAGKLLTEFDMKAIELANSDSISMQSLGYLAYLPKGHQLAEKQKSVNERIEDAIDRPCGKVGDRVTVNVEVMRVVYSKQYNVYFVTCITDQSTVLFFSLSEKLDVGTSLTIKGTVKSYRNKQTQLNRVKVL
jgi:hypothetical protein